MALYTSPRLWVYARDSVACQDSLFRREREMRREILHRFASHGIARGCRWLPQRAVIFSEMQPAGHDIF